MERTSGEGWRLICRNIPGFIRNPESTFHWSYPPSIILEELMWSKSLSIETIYSKLVGFWCLIASSIATICFLSSGHRMNRGMSLYESFSNSSCSLACMYSWWTSLTIYWSFAKWWKSDMPSYWILKASVTLIVFLMAAFLLVCFPTSYHSWISFWVLQ